MIKDGVKAANDEQLTTCKLTYEAEQDLCWTGGVCASITGNEAGPVLKWDIAEPSACSGRNVALAHNTSIRIATCADTA